MIRPVAMETSPAMAERSVVLPEPFGPVTQTRLPEAISSETFLSAVLDVAHWEYTTLTSSSSIFTGDLRLSAKRKPTGRSSPDDDGTEHENAGRQTDIGGRRAD